MKKRFLYTFLAAVITASVIDGFFFRVLSSGLRKVHKDFQGKLNYMLDGKDHYDVVFFGSSRVHNGINPLVFDSITKVNSYNAGMEGARIAELALFMEKFINNHGAPAYAFLSIDETVLETDHIWDFPRFFPYISDPDIFNLYIYQHEILFARYLPQLALTYYDDSRKSLALQGLLKPPGEYAYAQNKGYQPLNFETLPGLKAATDEQYQYYDHSGLNILNSICRLCKSKGIRLVFIVPPKLIADNLVGATSPAFARFAELANAYHAPVFDLSHKKEFTGPRLFYDGTHLIVKGADLYTGMIADEFNKIK